MEINTDISDELDEKLPSPHQSRFNSILSGMGNYGIFGTAFYGGVEAYAKFVSKKPANTKLLTFAVGSIFVGAAYGAWLGNREATQIEEYRGTISKHLEGMSNELRGNRHKIAELQKAVQVHAQDTEKAR